MKFKSGLEQRFHAATGYAYEPVKLPYVVTHQYTPDFQLEPNKFVECKGRFTGADRNKHLYIKAQHPDITIIFVFQDPHRTLSKNSKTTYAMWCDKHGFQWHHIKDIT